ncbi:DNA/RNA non-specific endonuclease [Portibacter marinus]|uniref:DNA/RNA non-specific endonuclease n=1 Tax=Portibacter marinus TaxID=2898660 RepID=UPI001F2F02F7|nr:DNA/RNA non-specific endonuclease [Portibacter marinus]
MAKFRRNHTKSGNFLSSSFVRIVAFLFLGGFALYYLTRTFDQNTVWEYEVPFSLDSTDRFYLPSGANGEMVFHKHYTLSYNEKYEQADWVAYELTKAQIQVPNVERAREFRPDDLVTTKSAIHNDYSGSGYTRGHLAPAGDMAFSREAMEESFLMSNISPQIEEFNGGVWRELEETVRDWAYDNDRVYVVTGPVLKDGILKTIGRNKVGVPKRFFKVVLDISGQEKKGIGYVLENKLLEGHLRDYAITIDSVESLTGFDFFEGLLTDEIEEELESKLNTSLWRFNQNRYENRNTRFR